MWSIASRLMSTACSRAYLAARSPWLSNAPAAPMREADRSPLERIASDSTFSKEPMALAAPPGTRRSLTVEDRANLGSTAATP